MEYQMPPLEYFDRNVSVWRHTYQRENPIQCTLGEFLSGKIFKDRTMIIHMRDLKYLFNSFDGRPAKLNIEYYAKAFKMLDGCSIPEAIKHIQKHVEENGKDEIFRVCKSLMPGATVSAGFENQRRKNAPLISTKIIAVDIDDVEPEMTIDKLINLNYKGSPLFFWVNKSISGKGVFGLIACRTENLEWHFNAINDFLKSHGTKVDELKDITRLRYWSIPTDAKYNANTLEIAEEYKMPLEINTARKAQKKSLTSLGYTTQYDKEEYAKVCHKKGLDNAQRNLNLPSGDIGDHLHVFLKYYQWAYNYYGLSQEFAVQWSWDNFFKNHHYIVEKTHTIDRIHNDFESFYASYRDQHHCLDFDQEKRNCLGIETYDLTLPLEYGKKIGSLKELPLIGTNTENSGWEKYILDSPTNSGKTSTFTNYFLKNDVKGLIVVPTQGALEQLKHDYNEVKLFYEKTKKVKSDDVLIATTYASFSKLSNDIKADRFLVVDEFHNMVLSSSKGFRNYELNYILDRIDKFDKVVLMTGTNLKCHHPALAPFKKVKVIYEGDTVKNFQIIYYNSNRRWNTLALKLKQYEGLQIIYMDDKKEDKGLGKLLDLLKETGYNESEIQLVNSDQKNESHYKSLVTKGRVHEKVKIIVVTKIFVEALNLYNGVDAFHILTPIHGAYMQQLVTRPRNNTKCDVYLYWSDKNIERQDNTYWLDQKYYYQTQKRWAEKHLRIFEDTEWDDIHRGMFNHADVIRKKSVDEPYTHSGFIDPIQRKQTKYVIDYLNCDYNTQEYQVIAYKKNPEQLYEYLRQYNWVIKEAEISLTQEDELDQKSIDQRKRSYKAAVAKFTKELVEKGHTNNLYRLVEKDYDKESWKVQIRMRYMHLNTMLREPDANELILRIKDNKRTYESIVKKLEIRWALNEAERDDMREVASKIFETFKQGDEFKKGDQFTSADVLKKIQAIGQECIGKIFDTKMLNTQTSATQFLNNYVETKRCKIPDPGGTPREGKKVAYTNGLEIISHHPVRRKNGTPIEPIGKGDRKVPVKPYHSPGILTFTQYVKIQPDQLAYVNELGDLALAEAPKEVQEFFRDEK